MSNTTPLVYATVHTQNSPSRDASTSTNNTMLRWLQIFMCSFAAIRVDPVRDVQLLGEKVI